MNHISPFFHLLGTAQHASEAVDNFDLHSEDAMSASKFSVLKAERTLACLALIAFVTQHAKELTREIMREEMRE